MKNSGSFHISVKNIDCGYLLELPRRGSSNKYPQSMFLSRNKINVYPCKPQFYCIKVGFKGGQNYIGEFLWWILLVDSEGPDQTAQMCRLVWAFALRICPKTFSHGMAQIVVRY